MSGFVECATCAAKPGTPTLCPGCLMNRSTIHELKEESERRLALLHEYTNVVRVSRYRLTQELQLWDSWVKRETEKPPARGFVAWVAKRVF